MCSAEFQMAQMQAELTAANATIEKLRDGENAEFSLHHENVALKAELTALRTAVKAAVNELGVPQPDYPQPVTNAYNILAKALAEPEEG